MSKAVSTHTESPVSFREDWTLDASHMARWLALSIIFLGLFMVWLGDGGASTLPRSHYLATALLLHGGAGTLWLLAQWRAQLALFLGMLLLWLLALVGYGWMQLQGFLLLLPLPLLLALLAGYMRAAFIHATVPLLLLHAGANPLAPADRVLIVTGMTATFLVGLLIRRSFITTIAWAWQHYAQAQRGLDSAHDRNAEMDQVLDELMHTNRQLDLLNERLAAMRAREEQAHRTKAAFVAKVSHEFRTPLNMIIGLIDLLIQTPEVYDEQLPPRLMDDLKIVHRNCEHLSSMINDVLDLSQTESGRLTLHRTEGNLAEDLLHALAVVQPLIEKKGLALHVNLPERPLHIPRDKTRIRQVFLNLLSNAARYTPSGSISVCLKTSGRHALVMFADTGPGIAPEDCERIFEPFFQESAMKGRSQKGTGLGLSISKQFIELHEGKLWVESVVGQGSTFFVQLPITSALLPAEPPHRWLHADWHWHERQPLPDIPALPRHRRILVFDQTDGYHPILDKEVEQCEFIAAFDLSDLKDKLSQAPAHAIAVNTGSASQLLHTVEQIQAQITDTPIIGWIVPSQTSKAHAAGALDYLVKPVTRADLLACLELIGKPINHVLIVDDDPDIQQLLARMLHSHNPAIQITAAVDVTHALKALRRYKPDLALVDLMLQQGTGWELLERKKKNPAIRDIPTVIISAQDPFEQPLTSKFIVGTMGNGLDMGHLIDSSIALIDLLLTPDSEPDPVPR